MGNLDKEEMQNRITALQRQARIPLPACLHLEAHLTACVPACAFPRCLSCETGKRPGGGEGEAEFGGLSPGAGTVQGAA